MPLLGGLGAGFAVLRGHVPTHMQGLLTVGGFLFSGLVLIPSWARNGCDAGRDPWVA